MVPGWLIKASLIAFLTVSGTFFTMGRVGPIANAENNDLKILFISSFQKDNSAQIDLESGLNESPGFRDGHHLLFWEFMDTPLLKEGGIENIFAAYLEKKYRDIKFDFVVGWAPRACRFLEANRDLFPDAHRIYIEVGDTGIDEAEGLLSKQTIIDFENDFSASMNAAFRLTNPSRFYVIGETDDLSSQNRLNYFKNSLTDEASKLPAEYILDQTVEQIANKLEGAPAKDAIAFYLLMFSDGQGNAKPPHYILADLASRSEVPIFTFWENMVGYGTVGGYVFSHQKIGYHLGETMISISHGEEVQDFSPMRYVFDWHALQKWKIDEKLLPADSIIRNRPFDILEQYRWHLLAAGAVFIVLFVFLCVLLWALKHRNIALSELDIERKMLEKKVDERTGDLLKTNKILTEEIDIRKQTEIEKEHVIHELEEAIEEIKTLKGILPLCSFCKKIRDDKGYWEQVDVYIHKHSEADISHSVCPECLKKHYPEVYASSFSDKE